VRRIEIIANKSVEADLMEALRSRDAAKHHTKVPVAHGVGGSGPRQGDAVWPEENFILIVYCEDAEARAIREAIGEIKKLFPNEGVRLFEMA
jgi:hypothetical protein